jgi:hypothetical protein
MQTIFRILIILSVAGLVAVGMYVAVQNDSVRSLLGVTSAGAQGMYGNGPNAGQNAQQSFNGNIQPGGGHGEGSGEGQNSSALGIIQNLVIFGGMIIGVITIQQIAAFVSQRKKIKFALHA